MSTLAERAKGTAFEILYAVKEVKPLTKAEQDRERGRLTSARTNAKRAAANKAVAANNQQKANWSI